MDSTDNIPIRLFGPKQSAILYKTYIFQKLCPGKFLIEDPWPHDELSDEQVEEVKDTLRELMPLDTMVTDMWDWDLHFEDSTFEDCYFDVALGPEDSALAEAENLKEDILKWIDDYGMDYDQQSNSEEEGKEFEDWVLGQSREFITKWRNNIADKFIHQI